MKVEALVLMALISGCLGYILTRYISARRNRRLTAKRLLAFADHRLAQVELVRLPGKDNAGILALPERFTLMPLNQEVERWLSLVGMPGRSQSFWLMEILILAGPLALALLLPIDFFVALLIGVILASLPAVALYLKASQARRKFVQQLPNAIDLMASVLRSGHSVPQAVKTVSEEVPEPCGGEFREVLQRMNVGQPLSHALCYTALKFQSYEVDLIRRAIAIHAEVGGSLADLIDKTNQTLKGRLKLADQVKTLTAQSRLSALIVGILPIVLALALNTMRAGYLNPLIETQLGRTLLMVAIFLEILGVIIMKRLSTVRV
jgi:tight adherence protein B